MRRAGAAASGRVKSTISLANASSGKSPSFGVLGSFDPSRKGVKPDLGITAIVSPVHRHGHTSRRPAAVIVD